MECPQTSTTCFGYTGGIRNEDARLQNNLHRWYEAGTGTWISQDPIGFEAGDANLYRYVGNGPTNAVDPSGLAKKRFEKIKNKDKSNTIKIREPFTIVILYGHGNKKTPHSFTFRPFTAAAFIGCDAGSTNRKIPNHNRLKGAKMSDGLIWRNNAAYKGTKSSAEYWDKKAMDSAKKLAVEWLKSPTIPATEVHIITEVTSEGRFTHPNLKDVKVTLKSGKPEYEELK